MEEVDTMDIQNGKNQKRKSIKVKFVWAIILLSIIVGGGLIGSSMLIITNSLEDYFAETISEKVSSFSTDYNERGARLYNFLSLVTTPMISMRFFVVETK